jgi:hypothetical protein
MAGRPELPESERRTKNVIIRVSPDEHRAIGETAKEMGVGMAALGRNLLLARAGNTDGLVNISIKYLKEQGYTITEGE